MVRTRRPRQHPSGTFLREVPETGDLALALMRATWSEAQLGVSERPTHFPGETARGRLRRHGSAPSALKSTSPAPPSWKVAPMWVKRKRPERQQRGRPPRPASWPRLLRQPLAEPACLRVAGWSHLSPWGEGTIAIKGSASRAPRGEWTEGRPNEEATRALQGIRAATLLLPESEDAFGRCAGGRTATVPTQTGGRTRGSGALSADQQARRPCGRGSSEAGRLRVSGRGGCTPSDGPP